uniref:NADH-ubiquinone oxidoreductase chain 3 n=1 Tax=Gyrodactylus brachymystacis TaxID=369907 RepID=A0A1C8FMS1_9PLAT|nr:NADH dehydrogenase subunit 3 [Gyrodactylus brachymystacis]AMO02265.1 NADH dehydrogenase subunit 3 [Gyrodactylus brachymystacis]
MLFYTSAILVFLLLTLMVHIYHLYLWNNALTSIDNVWVSSFECGFLNFSSAYSSFTYGFIFFLVVFVLFDLEVSLLVNFCFNISSIDNFVFYYLFILGLCLGFTFELLSGSLKWVV